MLPPWTAPLTDSSSISFHTFIVTAQGGIIPVIELVFPLNFIFLTLNLLFFSTM